MKKLPSLLLLLTIAVPNLAEARGGGYRGGHSRSYKSYGTHPKTYCPTCPRDKEGRIKRNSSEREKFLESQGLDHTPPGYQVDHITPLSKGGADKTYNMQLIPKNSLKEKNELK